MPEFNWPSKIKRYGITCPHQKFLVAKYESIIDWNGDRIESPEALDKHIQEKMLSALKKRINPESEESHYCRTINLAHMLANPAPHIEEARKIQAQSGADAARTFLLDHINGHKKKAFEAWWEYLTKGNPVYAKIPAFQYLMLRPIIESSDAKCTRSPVNPDAEALAGIFDGIASGQISPTAKLMRTLCEFMAFGKRADGSRPSFGTACAWMVVTSQMDKAADRVAALSQGSGWCVASPSMASSYLSRSDFHLLVENGRAVAAIRISGAQAVEIQGKGNQDPGPWWPRILLYLAARGIQISTGSYRNKGADTAATSARQQLNAVVDNLPRFAGHLKEFPAQVQFLSDDIANDDNYRPVVETAWLACVKADPLSAAIAPSWMARDKQLDEMVIIGWRNLLNVDPASVVRMPEALQKRKELAEERVICWAFLVKDNPLCLTSCPPDLQNVDIIISALKDGWKAALATDVRRIFRCPESVARKLFFTAEAEEEYISAITEGLKRHPKSFFRVPKWLRAYQTIATTIEQLRGEWPSYWARAMRGVKPSQTYNFYKYIPAKLRDHPEIRKTYEHNWQDYCTRYPGQIHRCPSYLLGRPDFISGIERSVTEHLRHCRTPKARRDNYTRIKRLWKTRLPANHCLLQFLSRNELELAPFPSDVEGYRPATVRSRESQPKTQFALNLAGVDWAKSDQMTRTNILAELQVSPERLITASPSIQSAPEVVSLIRGVWVERISSRLGNVDGFPAPLIRDTEFRKLIKSFWKQPINTKNLLWSDWIKCPKFVKSDDAVAHRAVAPITRALRRDPIIWTQIVFPWREMQELREEAAQNWATTPGYEDKEPPEDIRALVDAIRNE